MGHKDRDLAASAIGLRAFGDGDSDETGEAENSDKENDREPSTDAMMGLKKKSGAGGAKKNRGSDQTSALLESAHKSRGDMLNLISERNTMIRNYMETKTPYKNINIAPGENEFGFCLELKDLQFITIKACEHIGVSPETITGGILRKYPEVPASVSGPGQIITSVSQLETNHEITVDTFLSKNNKVYLRFSAISVEDSINDIG